MKFQLVSDSSCDLGREEMERLGVAMVSYYVAFEDEVYYREERDIPTHQFYQMMADRPGVFPKTSMPTLEDYLEAFRPLAAQGQPILCICLNANFSGSFQTALNAAEELREEYPGVSIRVMDSTLATVLQGLLVEEAAALRDAGFTLDEAAEALAALPATGRIFFTTSDLEYLRHGGRIGRAAAATGALLKVKPLIGYKDAGLISDGIAQGRKKSLVKVRELFFRHLEREGIDLDQYRLATGFGLDREEHAAFAQAVYDGLLELGCDRPEVKRPYQIGVTIGVHTGPTPIGVGLLKRAI
ncbi:MAG: DegV family protein [Lawsonibacter sp.]|jgi:DegV family protein with EDD domain|uniref:DegV family protein n=1 Tax=Lawsonibacter sp. JLR.KK007 TaxID=3114293 RepID=UPI00216EF072|nr:DegV family protein [Lawsonibacter sp.]MCI8990329.1 DegV family protein [Lawsonibacter sp.]MCI9268990.1 DegV family protein [Lawsonibacter sp.]